MKQIFTLLLIAMQLSASAFLNQTPEAIAVHPKDGYVVVGHKHGYISIVDANTLKVKETKKIGSRIDKLIFSADGAWLWVRGAADQNKNEVFRVDTKDWKVDFRKDVYYSNWSNRSNIIFYTSGYGQFVVNYMDMNSAEKTGAATATFPDDEWKIEGLYVSSDGKELLISGKKGYSLDSPGEIHVFPATGFNSVTTKKLFPTKSFGSSFGNGACSKDGTYLLIDWFNAAKLTEKEAVKIENWSSCYTVFSAMDGSFALASIGGNEAARFDFLTAKYSKIPVEKLGEVGGTIKAFDSNDDKKIYFVTDEHMIGIINEQGFVVKQKALDYKVNVLLRDAYSATEITKLETKLSEAGFKVKLPEKYDEANRTIIVKGTTVSKACEVMQNIRNKSNYAVQTIVELAVEEVK